MKTFVHQMTTLLTFTLYLSLTGTAYAHKQTTIQTERGEVSLLLPDSYSKKQPLPLLVSLHGFGGTGQSIVQYWEMTGQVDQKSFILAAPEGSKNSKNMTFWNATDACCDKDQSGIEDAIFLRALIETIEKTYAVDPLSIHVTGYSNGGFMAHKMACDHADKVASIVSIAGTNFDDKAQCQPSEHVHVLQIHGTNDSVIRYGGGYLRNYTSDTPIRHPSEA